MIIKLKRKLNIASKQISKITNVLKRGRYIEFGSKSSVNALKRYASFLAFFFLLKTYKNTLKILFATKINLIQSGLIQQTHANRSFFPTR